MNTLDMTCRAWIVTAAALAGCQAAPEAAWSSKSDSVLFKDGGGATLSAVDPDALRGSNEALRSAAVELLRQAGEARSPLLRANAIEALHPVPEEVVSFSRRGVGDDNRGVRFVAAMTIGQMRLVGNAPLLEPLLADPSRSVQAAAIYGLRRCGRRVDLNPLATMIRAEDPEVKSNAALVLGELGDPSAVPMLRAAVDRGPSRLSPARAKLVDLQLAEALVKLGEYGELEPIRAALFSPGDEELKAIACMMIGRLGDAAYMGTLVDIARREDQRQEPAEVRLAAIAALGELDPTRAPTAVAVAYLDHEMPVIRAQAALALGAVGDSGSLSRLSAVLSDADPMVQVAAAAAILKILG